MGRRTQERLDDIERVMLRVDAAMTRVETLVSSVYTATGDIRTGLQKFSNDIIKLLKSCGLLPRNQDEGEGQQH